MNTQDYFGNYQKGKARTSTYIAGSKFNAQAGDKAKQVFYAVLLPRIPDKPTEICDGPFHEFWVHRNCGPDNMQSLVCLNRNRDDFKSNKKKCPACSKVRKILNNESEYLPATVDKAKAQKAQNRVLWCVYDLNTRKGVEFLEVSGTGNDEIINEFQDDDGKFLDLTSLKNKAAVQITRTNSGMNSRYSYRGVVGDKYKLTNADIPKIKETYKYPENALIVLPEKEFKDIFESAFEVESVDDKVDDGIITDDGNDLNLDDLGGDKAERKPARSRGAARKAEPEVAKDDDLNLDDLGGDSKGDKPKGKGKDVIDDIEAELEGL